MGIRKRRAKRYVSWGHEPWPGRAEDGEKLLGLWPFFDSLEKTKYAVMRANGYLKYWWRRAGGNTCFGVDNFARQNEKSACICMHFLEKFGDNQWVAKNEGVKSIPPFSSPVLPCPPFSTLSPLVRAGATFYPPKK